MTQQDLADRVGVTRQTIIALEGGAYTPSLALALRIARERVEELLARIGKSKVSNLYEAEIRSLGEYGVLPLLRYMASPRSRSDVERRLVAMRIISDLAPTWAIGELIVLLKDANADVRFLSARALERLTSQTQGYPPEKWRGATAELEPAVAAWQTWWSRNRTRYPTSFGETPPPISAPPRLPPGATKARRPELGKTPTG
jgi:DNA-binding XRE family transcriptional regulator